MTTNEAKALINKEFDSKDGLYTLFRMSEDIEKERLSNFISALKILEAHYSNQTLISRDLVYKLFNFNEILQGSEEHWKVSRPKGLDYDTCFKIHILIRNIFTD